MIRVPVSYGELYDKITILLIKLEKLTDQEKLGNVRTELELLQELEATLPNREESRPLVQELLEINTGLWDIEEGKRSHERQGVFDDAFIDLARQVYIRNDRLAAVKKEINTLTGSTIVEEKSHESV